MANLIAETLRIAWSWLMLAVFLFFLWCLFTGNLGSLETAGGHGLEF